MNMAFPILPMLISIIAVPVYIGLMGVERYGMLTFVWILAGMYGLLDLGMGQAVRYRVAKSTSSDGTDVATDRPVAVVIRSAALFNLFAALSAVPVFLFVIGPWALGSISATATVSREVSASLGAITSLIPAALLQSVFFNVLEGRSQFFSVNLLRAAEQIATTVSTITVAWWYGPGLPEIILSVAVVRLTFTIFSGLLVSNLFSSFEVLSWSQMRELLSFGGWTSITQGLTLIANSLDRFAVGWALGASAAAYYAVPHGLLQRVQFVPQSLLRTMFPKLTATPDSASRGAIFSRSVSVILALTASVYIPISVLSDHILSLWIGVEFASASAPSMRVLSLAFWIYGPLLAIFSFYNSKGQPGVPARIRLISVLPFFGTILVLTNMVGVLGAAIGLLAWWTFELIYLCYRAKMLKAFARMLSPWLLLWFLAFGGVFFQLSLLPGALFSLGLLMGCFALAFWTSSDLKSLTEQLYKSIAIKALRLIGRN